MKIAADFKQREIVHTHTLPWIASPMAGVDRRALDRVGGEVARATTIVRYAPGSHFSPHTHTGGEEFIVLDGVFQDEHGDYPSGSYVRNPPQSKHTPRSDNGCIMLVKLWQFQLEDRNHINHQMNTMDQARLSNGVYITPLYHDHIEEVALYHLDANAQLDLQPLGGAELFVLEGAITEQQDELIEHSWLRVPIGDALNIRAGRDGAKIWLKTNHLLDVDQQIARVSQA
jgi:anti-sigma factor ChrR (cupin superfamily)